MNTTPQTDGLREQIAEIVSVVSAFSSDHGYYPHEGKFLPAAQSEEEAVEQILALITSEKSKLLTAIEGELPKNVTVKTLKRRYLTDDERGFNEALDRVRKIISKHRKELSND